MSRPRSGDDVPVEETGQRPTKAPRTSRAYLQVRQTLLDEKSTSWRIVLKCRNRKQHCDGPSAGDPLLFYQRCCQLGFSYSFAKTPIENESEAGAITIKKVDKLQKQWVESFGTSKEQRLLMVRRVLDHQKRIEDLELSLRGSRDRESAQHNDRPRDGRIIQIGISNGSVLSGHSQVLSWTGDLDLSVAVPYQSFYLIYFIDTLCSIGSSRWWTQSRMDW